MPPQSRRWHSGAPSRRRHTSRPPYTHPQYDPDAFFRYDLGVVVLDAPVLMSSYGKVPALNVLDQMAKRRGTQDVTFTVVGDGLQQSFPDAASWKEHNVEVRMVARPGAFGRYARSSVGRRSAEDSRL